MIVLLGVLPKREKHHDSTLADFVSKILILTRFARVLNKIIDEYFSGL
jgi:hypothetical protein